MSANDTPAAQPKWNALKHGLRAGAVLLPGDDMAAFRKLRREMFEFYKPRTIAEARCVEKIVSCEWRSQRCERWQGVFDAHTEEVLPGAPSTARAGVAADPHLLEHRGLDCTVRERRLDLVMARAEAKLALLQRQRAHNLRPDGAVVKDFREFMAEGEPLDGAEGAASTHSSDTDLENRNERKSPAAVRRFPKHWSLRQRQAALQREARDITQSPLGSAGPPPP